ncbi:hypothetical protein TH25_13955 [Thalassospira profundimaris]|uniref:N-acetyltransferase domain-containing protein n=1 Tax=Thalassospira profundimaris TaxID=502049 RepID=A0A367X7H5_9PROT|nr:GNAT family N-acetyltransferase [Thalassospira profundimaris]RCK48701.1 hypothetical protein TH25_13955 [Thalassospira profundimaris]
MQYRLLQQQDLPALEGFLSAHTSSTMFLRSNLRAAGMGRRNNHRLSADYYGAVSETGDIHAVIAHMQAGNILVQGGGHEDGNHTLSALAAYCRNRLTGRIAGVLGPSQAAKMLHNAFDLPSDAFAVNHDETLYTLALDAVKPVVHPLGDSYQVEDAARMDRATLLRWMRQYEIEALNAEENLALDGRVASRVVNALEDRCWWVLFADGQPVALAGFNARLPDAVQLGPVWTPPSHRNMGYARFLVGRCLLAARARGVKRAVLFTNNPAARRAYEALGFVAIGTYCLSQLRQPVSIGDQCAGV